jgi:hypothetical protein
VNKTLIETLPTLKNLDSGMKKPPSFLYTQKSEHLLVVNSITFHYECTHRVSFHH